MTTNETTLRPCPNCGAAARIRYRHPVWWVECKGKCGVYTGYYTDGLEYHDTHSKQAAIDAWNKGKVTTK